MFRNPLLLVAVAPQNSWLTLSPSDFAELAAAYIPPLAVRHFAQGGGFYLHRPDVWAEFQGIRGKAA